MLYYFIFIACVECAVSCVECTVSCVLYICVYTVYTHVYCVCVHCIIYIIYTYHEKNVLDTCMHVQHARETIMQMYSHTCMYVRAYSRYIYQRTPAS